MDLSSTDTPSRQTQVPRLFLLSNGTVTTVKAESALNIKKFTQAKFNPGETKLAELEGRPSSSDTVLDLEVGDLVVDIKKLDKKSVLTLNLPLVRREFAELVSE